MEWKNLLRDNGFSPHMTDQDFIGHQRQYHYSDLYDFFIRKVDYYLAMNTNQQHVKSMKARVRNLGESVTSSNVKVCPHFLKGTCKFGPKCRNAHPGENNSSARTQFPAGSCFKFL